MFLTFLEAGFELHEKDGKGATPFELVINSQALAPKTAKNLVMPSAAIKDLAQKQPTSHVLLPFPDSDDESDSEDEIECYDMQNSDDAASGYLWNFWNNRVNICIERMTSD